MFSRYLIAAIVFFSLQLPFAASAGENEIIIHDVVAVTAAALTIELEIVNEQDFIGFNCDIVIPEGFVFVEGSEQLFRATEDHAFVAGLIDGNILRLMSYSLSNSFHEGNDGVIASFALEAPQDPGDYLLEITGTPVIGSIVDGQVQNILSGVQDGTVSLFEMADEPECPGDIVLCYLDEPLELSGALPEGGQYSGPGVVDGIFHPADAGAGEHLITYSISAPTAPADQEFLSCGFFIIVEPAIVPTFDPMGPYCQGDVAEPLPRSSSEGFSGTWIPEEVDARTPGEYIHTFTPNDDDCLATVDVLIVVHPLPQLSCSGVNNENVSLDAEPFAFEGATPPGGTYGGMGVHDGIFHPMEAGIGTHRISYVYQDPVTNCESSCSFSIVVVEPEAVPEELEIARYEDVILQEETVCYAALQSIGVAGYGFQFTAFPGSEVTMIAGESIRFLPGVSIHSGAHLHAYISDEDHCGQPLAREDDFGGKPLAVDQDRASPEAFSFSLYPNPSSGDFTIVPGRAYRGDEPLRLEAYSMQGQLIRSWHLSPAPEYSMHLSDQLAGVYLLRLIQGGNISTQRLMLR